MSFGRLIQVDNLDEKFGSADHYYQVMVKSGVVETLLLTEHELDKIRDRVAKNPEDTEMVPSGWDNFVAEISGWF